MPTDEVASLREDVRELGLGHLVETALQDKAARDWDRTKALLEELIEELAP